MVGILATISRCFSCADFSRRYVSFNGKQSNVFDRKNIIVQCFDYKHTNGIAHTKTDDQVDLWLWGDIYGVHTDNGYLQIDSGIEFLKNNVSYTRVKKLSRSLNGEFVIFALSGEKLQVITDRMGTRPIYYFVNDDGEFAVSTNINELASSEMIDFSINKKQLRSLIYFQRTIGTETLFNEIYMCPPSAITEFRLGSTKPPVEKYWKPDYSGNYTSYKHAVSDLLEALNNAISDRAETKSEQSLLLSGGSDSRLIASSTSVQNEATTVHHMNDSMNYEAKIAKRVADSLDLNFSLLERDETYYDSFFNNISHFYNGNSWYYHAFPAGFTKQLSQYHSIICGQYSDTLLSGQYLLADTRGAEPSNVTEYQMRFDEKARYIEKLPSYLNLDDSDIVTSHIFSQGNELHCFGTHFTSIKNASEYALYYPISNASSFLFYESINQIAPAKYPFLDNRVVDIAARIPWDWKQNRDVVNSALSQQSPKLANIPHGQTRVPLRIPRKYHKYGRYLSKMIEKLNNEPHPGPWADNERLLREEDIIEEIISKNQEILKNSALLSKKGAVTEYQRHIRGEDRSDELFALITILESDSVRKSMC